MYQPNVAFEECASPARMSQPDPCMAPCFPDGFQGQRCTFVNNVDSAPVTSVSRSDGIFTLLGRLLIDFAHLVQFTTQLSFHRLSSVSLQGWPNRSEPVKRSSPMTLPKRKGGVLFPPGVSMIRYTWGLLVKRKESPCLKGEGHAPGR